MNAKDTEALCAILADPRLCYLFWLSVQEGPGDECWTRGANKRYGSFAFTRDGRKFVAKNHRVAYTLDAGNLPPDDYDVHHKCRNSVCCRPSHLEALATSDHLSMHGKEDRVRGYQGKVTALGGELTGFKAKRRKYSYRPSKRLGAGGNANRGKSNAERKVA